MSWVIKDVFSDRYFPKKYGRPLTSDISKAKIFDEEEHAIWNAVSLKKQYNSAYSTYLVLYGNGRWDPTWPVPKEYHFRHFELEDARQGQFPYGKPYFPPMVDSN